MILSSGKEHPGEFATLQNETSAAMTPVTKSKHLLAVLQSIMETVVATSTPYAKNSSHYKQLLLQLSLFAMVFKR